MFNMNPKSKQPIKIPSPALYINCNLLASCEARTAHAITFLQGIGVVRVFSFIYAKLKASFNSWDTTLNG